MTTIEQSQARVKAREVESAKKRDLLVEAHASLADAKEADFAAPTEKTYAAIKRNEKQVERAAHYLARAEKLEADDREELAKAIRTRRLEELDGHLQALHERPRAYAPYLKALLALRRTLEETIVAPLEKLNAEQVRHWEEANELAVLVGAVGNLSQRVARPRETEVLLMARLMIGEELGGAESRVHRYLESFERPPWDAPALPVFEAIEKLVESTKDKETEAA